MTNTALSGQSPSGANTHGTATRPNDLARLTPVSADSKAILMYPTDTLTEPREPDEPIQLDELEPRPPGRPVARCADGNGTMNGLFFSDHVADIARAKAMCGLCPLQAECLETAIERQEPWGVWGGELLQGGRIVGDKRPCGRPPKQPRPEVVYDEMGPVGIDLVTVA